MSENLKRMREALQFIPAHDRDIWVKMGMAIKSELGDEGYSIWETWSARGESYDSKAAKSVWQSIRASGNTTVKSLFHEAKGFGWRDDAYYAGILHSALNSTAAIHPESAPIALEADAKREAGQLHAAIKATSIWQASKPAPDDHPYLVRKGIKAHGARFHNGALVIPLRDGTALHSLQFIGKDGSKRFLTDGRVKGCYTSIGTTKDATVICIVEGFATGATIHESTGHPVAVALNAGNLEAVAMAIRAKYPDMPIIVCADDDTATIGNPGLSKAKLAALAVGGKLAIPAFGEIKPNEATDFNDMAAHCGVEAVKQAVAGATAVADVVHQAAGDEASKAGLAPDMPHGRVVTLMSAHEIAPEPIQWLWEGWLAEGKFHILGGAPGTGKTTLALALAATISCGGRWPDGSKAATGNVLIWSGEDDPANTLVPRLINSGAHRERIQFVIGTDGVGGKQPFDPATDMRRLHDAAIALGNVKLLIVDPVVSAVAGDSHKNADTRRALQPLVDLGAALGCAVLGITHFSKGTAGREPAERITGSLAFAALPRVVMVAAKNAQAEVGQPDRILARAKSNIGPDDGGFEYDLQQSELVSYPGVFASHVVWGNSIDGSAREILASADASSGDSGGGEVGNAREFLSEFLSDGAVLAKEVQAAAKESGFSFVTIKRAKKALDIESTKSAMSGGWIWQLPRRRSTNPEEAQQKSVNPFSKNDPLRRENAEMSEPSEVL